MSQDDPTNNGTAEDKASEQTSRRRFLKGGAAAAVGAIAAAAIPAGAEAHCISCSLLTADERKALANVLVAAWGNKDKYRERLLTFPENKPPRWDIYSSEAARDDALQRTRIALLDYGAKFPQDVYPVVLSHKQFEWGGFWKQDDKERIFQVPDVPDSSTGLAYSQGLGMYAIDVHICGM